MAITPTILDWLYQTGVELLIQHEDDGYWRVRSSKNLVTGGGYFKERKIKDDDLMHYGMDMLTHTMMVTVDELMTELSGLEKTNGRG